MRTPSILPDVTSSIIGMVTVDKKTWLINGGVRYIHGIEKKGGGSAPPDENVEGLEPPSSPVSPPMMNRGHKNSTQRLDAWQGKIAGHS